MRHLGEALQQRSERPRGSEPLEQQRHATVRHLGEALSSDPKQLGQTPAAHPNPEEADSSGS